MSFPRYSQMKDSGIDWLGQIPAHWIIGKFRHVYEESSEKIEFAVVGPMLSVSGYRGVKVKEYDDENRRRLAEDLVGYRIVRPGQLVVNTMWLNYAGLGVSDFEGHVSPAYRSYFISGRLVGAYAHHLMRSQSYVLGYTKFLTGIRPNSLQMSRDDLMSFPILEPPFQEQLAIAAFLDQETAKIDALVAEQKRLIELLKEKRQAVISQAVTKGLDPNVSMKDSGVEWLGQVPAHWPVLPIKRLVTSIEQGWSPQCENYPAEPGSWGVLKVGCVNGGRFNEEENKALPDNLQPLPELSISRGDVLVSRANTRELVGSAATPDCDHPNLMLCDKLYRLRLDERACMPAFLVHVLGSPAARGLVEASATGASSSMLNIGQSVILDMPMAVPPLREQESLLSWIDIASREADTLKNEATRAIDFLLERRSALISAAVTGKIDVRGLVPQSEDAAA